LKFWHLIPAIVSVILIILVAAYYFIIKPASEHQQIQAELADSLLNAPVIITEYGLPVDSFIIISGKIRKNQVLSDLFYKQNISHHKVNEFIQASKGIFDLRKIRYGNPWKFFCSRDSLPVAEYFVYEHSPAEYYLVDLTGPVRVTRQEKEIRTETRETCGVIDFSLWMTAQNLDLDPMLAIELSEIFAWTVDFFAIQKGDSFKVIYDELFADTTYFGMGKIHGAWFHNAGKSFYAIPFVQDSVESYFDQDGNSLRREFLKSPVRYSRISSRYSHSRMHPILRIRRPHHGVDYAAPVGTPVYSIGDGTVVETASKAEAGNMVRIRHNSVYSTAYLHLAYYGKGIEVGKSVKQGDVIGYVGSSGLSNGPHLDFRFYKNGYPVDPLKVEASPVEPVKKENKLLYDSVKTVMIRSLDQINIIPDFQIQRLKSFSDSSGLSGSSGS
jgi:murein DD-endopeptidase MepM/ murein hydrolase activator NlpD